MTQTKPLNWTPKPGVGLTVVRRTDGGMNLTFTDLSEATLNSWREFALDHLLNADRLTRNLYDLRAVKDIPEHAVRAAVEVNSDPSARNIRLAVVVADEKVANGIRTVAALALPEAAAAMKIFTDLNEAEAWLSRPLDQIA
ncbi:MAG: hypothetical protein HYR70_11125 [Chloroflexi bacterium]|nr:hypothetical protein [Chloroflexota bacterium]MBI1856605.1 hypothetical protein [Chloroflexota bacterium]MBI3340091.1 hypothetical protein [Chloroflexota bacterium]